MRAGCLAGKGNVVSGAYRDFIESDTVRTMTNASLLDTLPGCAECVFKPYCGVCPIYNYIAGGDVFKRSSYVCKINKGILEILFDKLQDDAVKQVFCAWVGKQVKKGGENDKK
jgi:radical SAM protein with 4Fe4S-binding SPASM domain